LGELLRSLAKRACSPQERVARWATTCRAELASLGASEPYEISSREWYLREIAENAEKVQGAAGNADPWIVVHLAMRLGTLIKEVDILVYEAAVTVGEASLAGAKRGGRTRAQPERDVAYAREFQARRSSASCSDTELKIRVGKEHGLKRSAAIAAIDRGLEKLRLNKIVQHRGKPDA